jgi:hypothetical protein
VVTCDDFGILRADRGLEVIAVKIIVCFTGVSSETINFLKRMHRLLIYITSFMGLHLTYAQNICITKTINFLSHCWKDTKRFYNVMEKSKVRLTKLIYE